MGRGFLTKDEIAALKSNPYVMDVNEKRISYSGEFKLLFIDKYLQGERPTEIFRKAGFDVEALGSKRIERACSRWKESYRAGTLGMYDAVLGESTKPHEYVQRDIRQEAVEATKKSQLELCHEQARKIKQLQAELDLFKSAFTEIAETHEDILQNENVRELANLSKNRKTLIT